MIKILSLYQLRDDQIVPIRLRDERVVGRELRLCELAMCASADRPAKLHLIRDQCMRMITRPFSQRKQVPTKMAVVSGGNRFYALYKY